MKLRELMSTQVETCRPQDSIERAAKLMETINVGAIPIVDGDRLAGILTDRDIVLKAVAQNKDPKSTTCQDCMTKSVITGDPDMTANEAAKIMADHQIRRLPVVENGKLVGITALGDMATISIHENEAGFALSEISEPSQSQNAIH